MKTFRRIMAVVLAMVMSLSMIGMVAFAAETIDASETGSLTIHKFEKDTKGSNGDGTEIKDTSSFGTGLDGVTFTLYQVMDTDRTIAYYNGQSTETVTVDSFLKDGAIDSDKVIGEAKTKVTADGGVATFTDLPVGMYVVIETAYPEKVTDPADPFLVSIPMTNPNNETEWMYDVHVYPKNSTSENSVTLVKKDNKGNPVANVVFSLNKVVNGELTPVNNTNTTPVTNEYTTNESGEINFGTLAHGTYRIAEVSAPSGYIVDKRPIEFKIDATTSAITFTDDRDRATAVEKKNDQGTVIGYEIVITNEKPTVTKTADAEKKNTVGVGDEITYTVTADVPANIALLETYEIKDTPNGMMVKNGTVAVTCEGGTIDAANYDITYGTPANGYTIDFTNPSVLSSHAGHQLVITYTAIITSDAATENKATNTVELKYDSVIDENGHPGTPTTTTDDEETKTFKATIIKQLKDGTTETVGAGIKFELYKDATLTQKVTVIQDANGNYKVADADDTNTTTELVTNADGKLYVSGLADATYYLVEIQTAEGYNLLSGAVELKVGDETDYEFETTVINKKGFTLPQTGGIGTLMFIIIGGVLMAGGVCLIAAPSKKRSV